MVKLSVQLNDFELDFFLNYTNAPYPLISIELRHPIYLFCSIGVLFCTHFQAKVPTQLPIWWLPKSPHLSPCCHPFWNLTCSNNLHDTVFKAGEGIATAGWDFQSTDTDLVLLKPWELYFMVYMRVELESTSLNLFCAENCRTYFKQ